MQIKPKLLGYTLYILALLMLIGNLVMMIRGSDIGYLYPIGLLIFMFGHLVISQAKKQQGETAQEATTQTPQDPPPAP